MHALFPPVLVAPILLAPFAYGHSLQPAPFGTTPSEHSVSVSFVSSANTLSSYLVDGKGYYEHAVAPMTGNNAAGNVAADDRATTNGFWPTGIAFDAFESKSQRDGSGTSSGNSGSSVFHSNGDSGFSVSSGSFGSGGPAQGVGLNGKGLGFLPVLAGSEIPGLGLETGGPRDSGPSVSTTPLPSSWTMMLLGLAAFGYIARRWQKKGNALAAA